MIETCSPFVDAMSSCFFIRSCPYRQETSTSKGTKYFRYTLNKRLESRVAMSSRTTHYLPRIPPVGPYTYPFFVVSDGLTTRASFISMASAVAGLHELVRRWSPVGYFSVQPYLATNAPSAIVNSLGYVVGHGYYYTNIYGFSRCTFVTKIDPGNVLSMPTPLRAVQKYPWDPARQPSNTIRRFEHGLILCCALRTYSRADADNHPQS